MAINKRKPRAGYPRAVDEDVEAKVDEFANQADAYAKKPEAAPEKPPLDKNAKRDFQAINVPFNEYEWEKLNQLKDKLGRSKLNTLRMALLRWAEEEGL